jgi:hypothetical protein
MITRYTLANGNIFALLVKCEMVDIYLAVSKMNEGCNFVTYQQQEIECMKLTRAHEKY